MFGADKSSASLSERRVRFTVCQRTLDKIYGLDRTKTKGRLFSLDTVALNGGFQVEPNSRSLKTFPTVIPIAVPMIAPATKSENQWIVIETPTPM